MQTLAQILASIPADPYQMTNQGVAPLLNQAMLAQQQPSGMQSLDGAMTPQMPMGGAQMPQRRLAPNMGMVPRPPGFGSMGDAGVLGVGLTNGIY